MIGLSAAFGNLDPNKDYIQVFENVHQVDGIKMFSYKYWDEKFACTLTMREELASEKMNSCFWEDEKYVVFIDGYIYPQGNSIAGHYILKSWLKGGADSVKNLNGEYNITIYNKENNEITFFNDRFASRKLYYTKRNDVLFAASEKKAIFSILNEKLEISGYGLIELFALSHNLGDTTIFHDIKVLTPASILSYKNGNPTVKKYWELNFRKDSQKISSKGLVNQMADTLKDAAEKKYRGRNNLGMGLSGGLDSRVVAVTVPTDIRPVFARTCGTKNSGEVIAASKIAERLSFNHFVHAPNQIELSKIIYPIVWRSESYVSFINLLSIVTHFELKDKMWYNLGGHFGDALTGKHLKPFMFFPNSKNEFIKKVFEYYTGKTYKNEHDLKRIFNPVFFEQYFNSVKENFYNSFRSINSENNPDLFNIWDLTQRQARFTFSSAAVDNYIFQKILLFTDYEFVDIMLNVKLSLRFGQILYKKMIATQFSIISNIPNSHTGKLIRGSILSNLNDMNALYYEKRKSKKGIYLDGGPGKGNLIRRDEKLKKMLILFVNDSAFPADIFSRTGILETVEEHYSGKESYDYLLGTLLTFVALFNLFIINKYKQMPDYAHPFQFSNKI